MVKFPQVLVDVRVKGAKRPFDEDYRALPTGWSAFEAEVNGAGRTCSAIRAPNRSCA